MSTTENSLVEINFSDSTTESQQQPDEVEDEHRIRVKDLLVDVSWSSMDHQVSVRSQSELRRIFPCLQSLVIQ